MHELEKSEDRQSPAKLALAIGLTVVFIAVVAVQVWGYARHAEVTARAKPKGTPADRRTAETFKFSRPDCLVVPEANSNGKWPKSALAECIEHDPFAKPQGFAKETKKPVQEAVDAEALQREIEIAKKRATQELEIAKLQKAGVNAILKGAQQSTAILGTRMVRVGEEINGFRVRAIEADGIIVERPTVR